MTSRYGCQNTRGSAYMVGEDKKIDQEKLDEERLFFKKQMRFLIRKSLWPRASAEQILRYQAYADAIGNLGIQDRVRTSNFTGATVPPFEDGSCSDCTYKSKQTGKCYILYDLPECGLGAMESILAKLGVTNDAPQGMLNYLRDGDLDRLADAVILFKQAPIDLARTKKDWEQTKAQIRLATAQALETEKEFYEDKNIDPEKIWKEGTFTPDYDSIEEKSRTERADCPAPVNCTCPEYKKGEEEGMSTATKALIAGGVVAALGAIWYMGSRPRG